MEETNFVSINRDPFARGDTVRRVVTNTHTCANCGNSRYRNGKPINSLFNYGWFADDKHHPSWDDKNFCCVDCRASYYN